MKPSIYRRLRTGVALALGAILFPVQAALVQVGVGNSVTYYADDVFWAGVSFSVVGDELGASFNGFNAVGSSGSPGFLDMASASSDPVVVAVAKPGFDFGGPFSYRMSLAGSYDLPSGNSSASALTSATVQAGNWAAGVFNTGGVSGSAVADASAATNGQSMAGAFVATELPFDGSGAGVALAVFDLYAFVSAETDNATDVVATAHLSRLVFDVSATAQPIPEPSSLALVVAAGGLVAWQRRRTRSALPARG